MSKAPAISQNDNGPLFTEVTLDRPIVRGSETISVVKVRKPSTGELRGLSISALAQLDVDELRKLLPRITMPLLTQADVDGLDPADTLQLGSEVVDFLLPKARKPAFPDR